MSPVRCAPHFGGISGYTPLRSQMKDANKNRYRLQGRKPFLCQPVQSIVDFWSRVILLCRAACLKSIPRHAQRSLSEMLGIMRKYKQSVIIKVVFGIIVLSFIGTIFLVWGKGDGGLKGSSGYAIKVDNTKISYEQYQESYARHPEHVPADARLRDSGNGEAVRHQEDRNRQPHQPGPHQARGQEDGDLGLQGRNRQGHRRNLGLPERRRLQLRHSTSSSSRRSG